MRFVLVALTITMFGCNSSDEATGTQIKEITITDNTLGEVINKATFSYDELNRISTIHTTTTTRGDATITISYTNGRVSWINDDSLVYENNLLTKTFFVNTDTTYITGEYKIENSKLVVKIAYIRGHRIIGAPNFYGRPIIVDTLQTSFEYDGIGNALKVTKQSNRLVFIIGGEPYYTEMGENDFDNRRSPFYEFPDEVKYILSYLLGPNNITKRTENGITTFITHRYNADGRPIKSVLQNSHSKFTTSYKYY
jgi:hypothetical protein